MKSGSVWLHLRICRTSVTSAVRRFLQQARDKTFPRHATSDIEGYDPPEAGAGAMSTSRVRPVETETPHNGRSAVITELKEILDVIRDENFVVPPSLPC